MVRLRKPIRILLVIIDNIIANITNIDSDQLTNKYYILNRLYYLRYAIRVGKNTFVIMNGLNEVNSLLRAMLLT